MKYSQSLDLLMTAVKAGLKGEKELSSKLFDRALRMKDLKATLASLDRVQSTALASMRSPKLETAAALYVHDYSWARNASQTTIYVGKTGIGRGELVGYTKQGDVVRIVLPHQGMRKFAVKGADEALKVLNSLKEVGSLTAKSELEEMGVRVTGSVSAEKADMHDGDALDNFDDTIDMMTEESDADDGFGQGENPLDTDKDDINFEEVDELGDLSDDDFGDEVLGEDEDHDFGKQLDSLSIGDSPTRTPAVNPESMPAQATAASGAETLRLRKRIADLNKQLQGLTGRNDTASKTKRAKLQEDLKVSREQKRRLTASTLTTMSSNLAALRALTPAK